MHWVSEKLDFSPGWHQPVLRYNFPHSQNERCVLQWLYFPSQKLLQFSSCRRQGDLGDIIWELNYGKFLDTMMPFKERNKIWCCTCWLKSRTYGCRTWNNTVLKKLQCRYNYVCVPLNFSFSRGVENSRNLRLLGGSASHHPASAWHDPSWVH